MLGTGNAMTTACYQTCFILQEREQLFLVDGGGGNGLLKQLKAAGIDWRDIREMFITHKHIDHLGGILWMVRMILQHLYEKDYEGDAVLYGPEEVIDTVRRISEMIFMPEEVAFFGKRLFLVPLRDGDTVEIAGHRTTVFDVHSPKTVQFGFSMHYAPGKTLVCLGDEPYREVVKKYVEGATWLMAEAFCQEADEERFRPYEKNHSTVRSAAVAAEASGVKNLLLYHTEDEHLANRKALYSAEGKRYFSGRLEIPDDLEVLEID